MIAAFDHPFLSGLLGDAEVAQLLGVEAELSAMLRFEIALAEVESEAGIIPAKSALAIVAALAQFQPDMDALKDGVGRDGVVVPEVVRQLRQAVGEPHAQHVHFGTTSQDVIDTALVLRIGPCLDVLQTRLNAIVGALDELDQRFGRRTMMAHTRMQPAISIGVSDRIRSWRAPLVRNLERLDGVRRAIRIVQFGGAAGALDKLGDKGPIVRAALAKRLDLSDTPQWHSQRDGIAELANWLSLVTGSLGKFGQDIALLAQTSEEIALDGGGGSSAMPHKQNPVHAEALVALAHFNATQLSGIHHALVHEQERSGAAWTLEWLILPQMVIATAAATGLAVTLIANMQSIGVGDD